MVEKEYYKNGNLKLEIPHKNGKRHGVVKWYDENGNLRRETPYKNDKIHGVEKGYYENGKLKYKKIYRNGIEMPLKGYGWYWWQIIGYKGMVQDIKTYWQVLKEGKIKELE